MNKKCSSKPNCVSTLEEREDFSIIALTDVQGNWDSIKETVKTKMKSFSNITVKEEKENFLHLVVTTRIMRFKDDIYFWWSPGTKTLNFKSESRAGHWDMGANRKRMSTFIEKW